MSECLMKKYCSETQQPAMSEIAQSVRFGNNLSDPRFCNKLKTNVLFVFVGALVWQKLCTTGCCELPHSF